MRRTVSALPDCLASHYSATLEELEVIERTVEEARSLASASESLRTDIELPGVLRYLRRVVTAVHAALLTLRALAPDRFAQIPATVLAFSARIPDGAVLMGLRHEMSVYLVQLPTPFGFNPSRANASAPSRGFQQRTGADPPFRFVEACLEPVADRYQESQTP